MKTLFTFLTGVFFCAFTFAQTSGGPDPYGYTWKSNLHSTNPPAFNWIDITTSGTLVTGLGDDNYVGPFTGSNGFQFYWYSTPTFYIGSNGFLAFNGVNIASPFPASMPSVLGANDFLAPLLSDLNFAGSGNPAKCYYYATTDSLVVSYIDVPFWASGINYTGSNTFQIILNKTDNSITYNYLSTNMGINTSIDDIIGIENVTGTLGLQCFADTLPGDSLTIKFTYPSTVTYQAIDAGMNWADNENSGGIFIKANGAGIPSVANVRNNGNQNISGFSVYDTLYTVSGNSITGGQANVSGLTPGQDVTVTFSDTIASASTGRHFLRTRIIGVTGDLVGANNVLEIEVNSVDTNAAQMNLEYSDGQADGTGLGWSGGGGGIGIYIEPPIYPAKVKDTRFYLTALGSPVVGFHSIIYDDDGPNGGPGTVLDSVYVGPSTLAANNYKNVTPSQDVIIDSGGVYLLWLMGGAGINLGRDLTPPFSRRTYEVLFGSWSGYRDRLTEDFLMGMRVTYAFPLAKFNIDATLDPTFAFTDKSSNKPTSWYWEFGDGSTDTVQNPSHTYISNDTFNVCLTASNKYGSDSACKSIIVEGVIPTADFTFDDSNAPLVRFYDQSLNSPTAWHWDFNVGAKDTSNTQNTAYNYKANGTYNVCLTAINKNGSSAPACKDVTIMGIGIEDYANSGISFYPNPMTNNAQIELSEKLNSNNIQVKLYNILGKDMNMRYSRNGQKIQLFRDNLNSGPYILEVREEDKVLFRSSLQIQD